MVSSMMDPVIVDDSVGDPAIEEVRPGGTSSASATQGDFARRSTNRWSATGATSRRGPKPAGWGGRPGAEPGRGFLAAYSIPKMADDRRVEAFVARVGEGGVAAI
jgi:hypothetical protein